MNFGKRLQNQKGVVLVAVIFMLIAIGGLGVAINKISQNQAKASGNLITSTSAFYSTQAAAYYAAQQMTDKNLSAPPAGTYTLPGGATVTVAGVTAISAGTTTGGGTQVAALEIPFPSCVPNCGGGGGGGGGGGWTQTCTQATATTGITTLFASYTAVGGQSVTGISGTTATGITPQTVSVPAIGSATYCTPTSLSSGTTNWDYSTCSSPSATNPNYMLTSLNLNNSKTLNITGPTGDGNYLTIYITGNLTVKDSANLNITGNVRFAVQGSITIKNSANVVVPSPANLLLMAVNDVQIENSAKVNKDGSANNVLIMSTQDIKAENSTTVKAGLFANGDVKVEDSMAFTGAIVAGQDAKRRNSASIDYLFTAGSSVISAMPVC